MSWTALASLIAVLSAKNNVQNTLVQFYLQVKMAQKMLKKDVYGLQV